MYRISRICDSYEMKLLPPVMFYFAFHGWKAHIRAFKRSRHYRIPLIFVIPTQRGFCIRLFLFVFLGTKSTYMRLRDNRISLIYRQITVFHSFLLFPRNEVAAYIIFIYCGITQFRSFLWFLSCEVVASIEFCFVFWAAHTVLQLQLLIYSVITEFHSFLWSNSNCSR